MNARPRTYYELRIMRFKRCLRLILYYVLAILLIATSNTLYGKLEQNIFPFYCATFACMAVLTIWLWVGYRVNKPFLARWSCWGGALSCIYALVALLNHDLGPIALRFYLAIFLIAPLFIHLVRQTRELERLVRAIVDVMLVLGTLSVVAWFYGDVLQAISYNCSIITSWGRPGAPATLNGYYYVFYDTQPLPPEISTLGLAGRPIYRNTGIFTEAPMHAFALCCALLLEIFATNKPRKAACAILLVTIATTASTTGIVVALAAIAFVGARKLWLAGWGRAVLIVSAIALAAAAGLVVLKLGTGSGSTRVDDFAACFAAWAKAPLFGNGFSDTLSIRTYLSSWRISNTGLANTLGYVLATGGLAYFALYVAAFVGYFTGKTSFRQKAFGACYLFLWTVTIVFALPLSAFMLAFGIERICNLPFLTSKKKKGPRHTGSSRT